MYGIQIIFLSSCQFFAEVMKVFPWSKPHAKECNKSLAWHLASPTELANYADVLSHFLDMLCSCRSCCL